MAENRQEDSTPSMIRRHDPQRATGTASLRWRIAVVVVAFGTMSFVSHQADAQSSVGGSGLPNVSVDFSVINELGPPPSVPEVLRGAVRIYRPAAPPPRRRALRFPDIRRMKSGRRISRVVLKPPSMLGKPALTPPSERRRRTAASAPTIGRPKAVAKAIARVRPAARAPAPAVAPPSAPRFEKPTPIAKAVRDAAPKPRRRPPGVTVKRMPPPRPAAVPKAPPVRAAVEAPTKKVRKAKAPPPPPAIVAAPAPAPPIPAPPVAARITPPEIKPMVAVKPAAPKRVTKPKPAKQVASLPPKAAPIAPGQTLRLTFPPGTARLTPEASRKLARVAKAVVEDSKLRLQLLAYAGGSSETASQARRLSLSRALSARSFLIGKGVRSTRIDVRALGNKSGGGPPDRIDVLVTKR